MRTYDEDDIKELNAEPWQTELLKLNPEYVYWGPHEDYMWNEKEGWDGRIIKPTYAEFGPWDLDDLNECVNFYFSVNRKSKECPVCGGSGYHPDAQWISESFYGHSTPFRHQTFSELQSIALMDSFGGGRSERRVSGFPSEAVLKKYGPEFREFCEQMRDGDGEWNDKITQDEAEALGEHNRLFKGARTATELNALQAKGGLDGHDCINRGILIEQRCKRLGVPTTCETCNGRGSVYIEPSAHVSLTLWWLHPRKGCSRGIEIERIEESDVPAVFDLLSRAAKRNAERFAKLPNIDPVESP